MQPNRSLPIAALLSFLLLPPAWAVDNRGVQPEAKRTYIETSYLIAPRRVGDFVLEGHSFDEQQKYSGAKFRYMVDGQQETRIDVFVYPAGTMGRDAALDHGMDGFRADMAGAVKAKAYTNLVMQDEQEFLLSEDEIVAASDKPNDRNAAELLRSIAEASRPVGRKLAMTLNWQPHDWPMHSVGYLFYKQLYYFKVRATAAQQRITTEQFYALTDRAARALVPAIEVANIGDCANSTITIAASAPPKEAAKVLVTQATEHQGYNCHLSGEDAEIQRKSIDAEVVSIVYQPSEWKSE